MSFKDYISNIGRVRKAFGGNLFPVLNVITKDGNHIRISVQGSDFHYSEPRENLRTLGHYSEVEIGFLAPRSHILKRKVGVKFFREDPMFADPKKLGFKKVRRPNDEVCAYVDINNLFWDLDNLVGDIVAPHTPYLVKKLSRSMKSNKSEKNALKVARREGINTWVSY